MLIISQDKSVVVNFSAAAAVRAECNLGKWQIYAEMKGVDESLFMASYDDETSAQGVLMALVSENVAGEKVFFFPDV